MSRPAKILAWFALALLAVFMAIHIGEKPRLLVDEIAPVAAPRCVPMANPCDKIDCDRPKPMEMS